MIRGIRRPEEAQGLGVSRRLLARVGALLKKSVEITPAALECAKPGTPVEALLLDSALLEDALKLDAAALKSLASTHLKESGSERIVLDLHAAEGGVRVICLREELEAEGGWDASEAAAPAPVSEVPGTGLALRRPALRSGAEGAEALFTPIELDRLRLKLVTAAAGSERIEALRVLAHAPLAPAEKADAIFRALEDRDETVRAEAASLLFVLGIADDLGESLQALAQGAEPERLRAAERLVKRLSTDAKEIEQGAAAVCALAAFRTQAPGVLAARLLDLLRLCAPALIRTPPRVAELARVTLSKLVAAGDRDSGPIFVPASRLFRALCQAGAEAVVPILYEERAKATDPACEAFLLQLLLDFPAAAGPAEDEVFRQCAAFLARDSREGRDSRAVGMSLAQRGEPALRRIVEAYAVATPGAQKYLVRLADDIVRYQKVSPEAKELAAAVLLQAVESPHRGLRMIAMQSRFATDAELSEATRTKLARAFLESCNDFGFRTEVEIVEDGIARLGLPAVAPLCERLAPERPAETRAQAARILGELALNLKVPKGEMKRVAEAVTEILRRLQALAIEPSFPNRGTLYESLGKLAASPAASKQSAEVVSRHLFDAVRGEFTPEALGALEGLTWLAASHRAHPPLVATVAGLLRRAIDEARTDLEAQVRVVDGQKVIEIGGGQSVVEVLPVALGGVSRLACSRSCPPALTKELVHLLLERWKRIVSGELIWGPANAMLAVRAFQEIGGHPDLPDDLRMEILKGLAPRLSQPVVLQATSAILGAHDRPASSPAALTLGLAIAGRRRPDGRYEAEDRPDILKALARIAGRKHLGSPALPDQEKAQRFRESAIEDLFAGAKDIVPGAYEGLQALRAAGVLPRKTQETLERRLSEFHGMTLPV